MNNTQFKSISIQCNENQQLFNGLCYPNTCINDGGIRISSCACDLGKPNTVSDCSLYNNKECPYAYTKIGECTCQKKGGVVVDCKRYGNPSFGKLVSNIPIYNNPIPVNEIDTNLININNNISGNLFEINNIHYIKSNTNSDYCINVNYGSAEINNRINLWKCDKTNKQKWIINNNNIQYADNPRFCITAKNQLNGFQPVLNLCNNSNEQHWKINNGLIKNDKLNKCFNINNNDIRNDTDINIGECNNTTWFNESIDNNLNDFFNSYNNFKNSYPNCDKKCACNAAKLLFNNQIINNKLTSEKTKQLWNQLGLDKFC